MINVGAFDPYELVPSEYPKIGHRVQVFSEKETWRNLDSQASQTL